MRGPSIQPDSQCCWPSELLDPVTHPVSSWTAGVAPWWENKLETGTCAGFLIWSGYYLTAFIQFSKLLPTSNCSNRRTRKNQRKKEGWFKRHFFFYDKLYSVVLLHKRHLYGHHKSPTIYYQWHSTVPAQLKRAMLRIGPCAGSRCSGESRITDGGDVTFSSTLRLFGWLITPPFICWHIISIINIWSRMAEPVFCRFSLLTENWLPCGATHAQSLRHRRTRMHFKWLLNRRDI